MIMIVALFAALDVLVVTPPDKLQGRYNVVRKIKCSGCGDVAGDAADYGFGGEARGAAGDLVEEQWSWAWAASLHAPCRRDAGGSGRVGGGGDVAGAALLAFVRVVLAVAAVRACRGAPFGPMPRAELPPNLCFCM